MPNVNKEEFIERASDAGFTRKQAEFMLEWLAMTYRIGSDVIVVNYPAQAPRLIMGENARIEL